MVADVCEQLITWVSDAVDPVVVDAEPPTPSRDERVSCFLASLSPVGAVSGTATTPMRFGVTFVISVDAPTSGRAVEILDLILTAAAGRPDLELLASPPDTMFWRAFGVAPRPAIVVRASARVERSLPSAAPVRAPLIVQGASVQQLRGRVTSRQGVPIAAAEVRLRGTPRSVWTDDHGHFTIASASGDSERLFTIDARGRRFAVALNNADDTDLELIIDPLGAQP